MVYVGNGRQTRAEQSTTQIATIMVTGHVGTTIETFYQRTNEIKITFIGTMIVCVLVCPGVGGVGYYDGYNVVDDVKHMWCTMNLKCVYTRMRRIDKCRRAVRAMSRGKST